MGDTLAVDDPEPQENPQQLVEKYNAYVGMAEELDDRLLGRYAKEFGLVSGEFAPNKAKFHFSGGEITGYFADKMEAGFAAATDQPPLDVDDLVTAMAGPTHDIISTINEIYEYYEYKEYVDDDFQQGEALHEALVDGVDRFLPAYEAFLPAYAAMMRQREADMLDEMRAQGALTYAAILQFITAGRNLAEELERQDLAAANLLEMDEEAFTPVYEQLTEAFQAMRDCRKDETQLALEGFDPDVLDDLIEEAGEVRSAAADMLDRVRNQRPFSDTDLRLRLYGAGSPEGFVTAFNNFIEEYNREMLYMR